MHRLYPPPLSKRYVLRLFISLKHITATVIDRNSGRVAVSASSLQNPLKSDIRTCNVEAARAVGEVLAMRLKVEGIDQERIYASEKKEVERKGFKNRSKVWAILNAIRDHGVNLQIEDCDRDP